MIKLMDLIDKDPKFMHFNYEVNTDNYKENRNYKIVSP